MDEIIKLEHVGMRFNLSKEKVDSVKEYFIKMIRHELKFNEYWALKDVSFTVNKGDRV